MPLFTRENENPRRTSPTLRELGVSFDEPKELKLLDTPLEITRRTFGENEYFVGAPFRTTLDKRGLHVLLGELKTHPESQSLAAAVADWKKPFNEEAHRSLGKHGEWDILRKELRLFIDVAEYRAPDEGLLDLMIREHWYYPVKRHLLMGFMDIGNNGKFGSYELSSRQLAKALETFGVTLQGKDIVSGYKDGLRRRGLLKNWQRLKERPEVDFDENEQAHMDSIGENIPAVVAFLKYLGRTPLERIWSIFKIAADTSCWNYPLTGYSFDRNTPNRVEIQHKRMELKRDGIRIITHFAPPRFLEVIEDPSYTDEDEKILNPIIRLRNPSPVKSLIPVWVWRKTPDGGRHWLFTEASDNFRRNVPSQASSNYELPSSLAGYLHLAYALPQLRDFPQELPFHRGDQRKQKMQEGQVPYLAMFYQYAFVNSQLIQQLEQVAIPR